MVDLHCHILPGLDDGPKAMEDSLAMAESAIADGITHVVATPHANSSHVFDYPKIRALQKELQSQLGNRLTLATGCDFHLSPENVEALQADAAPFASTKTIICSWNSMKLLFPRPWTTSCTRFNSPACGR